MLVHMYQTDTGGRQILTGRGRQIHAVPDDEFVRAINGLPGRMASRLAFMSCEHHAIRDFVVREMMKTET